MPFSGTFKNEASKLAFSSISFSFRGRVICNIGNSGFPLRHKNIFCFVLKSSVFISTLIDSCKN